MEAGDQVYDMIWVEDWRGDDVRSRLCVRQYDDGTRTDLFAATPDSFLNRYQLASLSTDPRRACLIIDVTTAFMHAPIDEEVKVEVPKDILSATG